MAPGAWSRTRCCYGCCIIRKQRNFTVLTKKTETNGWMSVSCRNTTNVQTILQQYVKEVGHRENRK